MFRKHLLYLSNDHLTAYTWNRGKLSLHVRFENNDSGRGEFSRFATASAHTPLFVLADLIEEDFQRDTVPHVFGKTRRAMLERKLNQYYRETPYRCASFQGRESEGRRDDLMLFSALTNQDWVTGWISMLIKAKAPLSGIYSPGLLGATLLKKMSLVEEHLLLISVQSSGLRQSYFQGMNLKFSRLTALPSLQPADIAEAVSQESRKTEQFLGTSRMLPRGKTMKVLVLGHGDMATMAAACPNTNSLNYRFTDTLEAAAKMKWKEFAPDPFCDTLLLTLMAFSPPAIHYAQPDQVKYHKLWQIRLALHASSGAALAGALLMSGNNALNGMEFDDQKISAELEAKRYETQYLSLTQSFPKTPTSPQNMKSVAELRQLILNNGPMPETLLATISKALQVTPRIKLNKLKWEVAAAAPVDGGPVDGGEGAPPQAPSQGGMQEMELPPVSGGILGIPSKPAQSVQIEGEIVPFKLDFRSALSELENFISTLEQDKAVKATLSTPPLDIRPQGKISGNTELGQDNGVAIFTFKIEWKPGN